MKLKEIASKDKLKSLISWRIPFSSMVMAQELMREIRTWESENMFSSERPRDDASSNAFFMAKVSAIKAEATCLLKAECCNRVLWFGIVKYQSIPQSPESTFHAASTKLFGTSVRMRL